MPSPVGTNRNPQRTMNFPDSLTALASTARRTETPLRTLIIDNYDSYTFNLLQLFDQDQLNNVVVIHNDQVAWSQFEQDVLPYFDQIILSPGPGRPERAQDFGICTQILKTSHIPIFGVCLGHQGIGWTHGAKVTYGPEPVHGQIAHIKHDNTGLFEGIPQEFEAVRYHSLVIQEQDLPPDLIPTAWCHSFPLIPANNLDTGNVVTISNTDRALGSKSIMGVRHKTLPHHGVQFHPESICTQHGKQMMSNFFKIACEFYVDQNRSCHMQMIPDHIRQLSVVPTKPSLDKDPFTLKHQAQKNSANPYSLFIHAMDPTIFPEPETVFSSLFLTGPRSKAASWWLDSARQPHPMSRFSFMGGMETRCCRDQGTIHGQRVPGASQAIIQYSTLHKEIRVRRYMAQSGDSEVKRVHLDHTVPGKDVAPTTFWDWISHTMGDFSKKNMETIVTGPSGEQRDFEEVPFDFFAGMIGYLGYEMKRESLEGYQTPVEQQCHCPGHSGAKRACTCDCLRRPDASFVLATQAVVFDHVERRVYVLGIVNNQPERSQEDIGGPVGFDSRESCENWIQEVTRSIVYLANNGSPHTTIRRKSAVTLPIQNGSKGEPYSVKQRHRRQSCVGLLSPFKVDVTEKDYLKAIQDSLDYIHEGESYELCLTTQFRAKIPLYTQPPTRQDRKDQDQAQSTGDPAFDLYRILRKLNPAPFSAFLSVPTALDGEDKIDEVIGKLIILSSSPERFLKIGKKPSDEATGAGDGSSTSRTVEMKPIKGTIAVAKGCFCKEDEGCGVDEQDDGDSSEHTDEDEVEDEEMENYHETSHSTTETAKIANDERRRSISDRCAEARRRENQSRIDSLSKNIKERAENLMIVDLIRNDLAHVCTSKSVRVPYLMHVESYETVHQLVTTVRGELFDHVDSTQAVRACFPPGSMTGAPKLRSVQLLDSLEHHVTRGVYSGCLGYIGIPAVAAAPFSKTKEGVQPKVRSAVDLAVVIRTAVLTIDPSEDKEISTAFAGDLSVGAGGALTILSDANEEWREVLLKSRSVVPSILTYLHQHTA